MDPLTKALLTTFHTVKKLKKKKYRTQQTVSHTLEINITESLLIVVKKNPQKAKNLVLVGDRTLIPTK